MMHDQAQEHIGQRVRVARIAAGLTQPELAGLVSRSQSWIEDLEAGRLGLDRYSVISAIADVCEVDVVWLLGQPYRLRGEDGAAAHSYIRPLRTVLRRAGLILSGHPGLVPSVVSTEFDRMQSQAMAANRARQGASLPSAAAVLPGLLEDLSATILLHDRGPQRELALRLLVDAARNARQTLNQLGYPDLAWVAAEVAAGAATQLGDPIAKAAVAWDRCGAMLHQGDTRETEAIAKAALDDLDPLAEAGGQGALALQGALVLRTAVACARSGRADDAWAHGKRALEIAGRLPENFADLEFQTVFGRANVQVHAAEVGVEVDEPAKGLAFVKDANLSGVPSRERITHFRIDEARALHQMGRTPTAVATLRQAATRAPHYVYAHPMARALVHEMVRKGVPTQAAALSGLVRNMALAF
ncbi:helix-turn-helix domain-containing protein [Streptomyces nojiriensis]|uniref:helix-turn-helix domain-containing protein n=1 Tax=Streptomyces nojiriensis TaxID=66374 RepID=UPI0036DC5264